MQRTGFTLVEVLIVVTIMAILAGAIIPQFINSAADAKASTNKLNLRMMRSQIALYGSQHNNAPPSGTLIELLKSTNANGSQGTGPNFPYGPYLREIPVNAATNSASVKVITNNPAAAADVTSGGGWLYNPTTGGIWIDSPVLFAE